MGDSTASSTSGGRRRVAYLRGRDRDLDNETPTRYCHCGVVSPLRTSWTEVNPGRRFYGCRNYHQGGGCGYFHWHDEEMGERSIEIINELLDYVDKLYDENARHRRGDDRKIAKIYGHMKKTESRLRIAMIALVATWLFILWLKL